METSKLEGAKAILSQKLESTTTQMSILDQDISTMEKRLSNRNETILEDRVKAQNSEILKLHDEILSRKIHASRSDDTLLSLGDDSPTPGKVTDGITCREDDKITNKKNESTNDQSQEKGKTNISQKRRIQMIALKKERRRQLTTLSTLHMKRRRWLKFCWWALLILNLSAPSSYPT